MSSLINNLNSIYEIKQEIKEILQTDEEVFSYYPGLITEAIASGGATGTIEIVTNGTHDVSTYASAYVNVPQQEVPVVPAGYTYVYGGKDINTNANNIDVASYSYVNVSVAAPEGWLYPSGYAYITTNGDFNIREFNSVNVNVPQSGLTWEEVIASGYTYVKNETYMFNNHISLSDDGDLNGRVEAPGYEAVELHLGLDTLVNPNAYSITANGTFNILTYGTATVNVPIDWAYVAACGYTYTGGGSTPTVVNWSDIVEINQETSNPEYIGPADGTVVQMTDDLIDASSFTGQSLIDSNLISMISGAGATDLANHLQSYIGSYLLAFANDDFSSNEPGIYIVSDNSYVSGNATVTGPIYNLSPYQSGGIYWWPEIDACSDVVINS